MDDPIKVDTLVLIIQMRQPGWGRGGGGCSTLSPEKAGASTSAMVLWFLREFQGTLRRSRTQVKCSMKEAKITKET